MRLDDAYAIGEHIPRGEEFPPRWAAAAQRFRDAMGARARLGLSYGPSDRQFYDLFLPESAPIGLVVFVHGGYWKAFDPRSWSHLAAGAVARGWAVALPGYDLCPNVRIGAITQQISAAIQQVADQVAGPIALTGHSAGGHLVARMAAVLPEEAQSRIARIAPISPLADLEPLLDSPMNDTFGLDLAEARAESPMRQPKPAAGVKIWVGADETPALLYQSDLLARTWNVPHVAVPEKHHFDVIEALETPDSDLVRWLTQAP